MIEAIRNITIAGPCAAESEDQVMQSAHQAKRRGVDILRACLWKPRTRPGFEGVGIDGIKWLDEVSRLGIIPATEVITVENAHAVVDQISGVSGKDVLVWIGSRNQNHLVQQEIGQVVKGDPHSMLLIKNQPWESLEHWLGIVDHVVKGGADPKQIILCHRGFAPEKNTPNPRRLRNIPDWEMAMEVKKRTGMPMLIDPSHMGGERSRVMRLALEAEKYRDQDEKKAFDGLMIEVHPDSNHALTDSAQQLSWQQFDEVMQGVILNPEQPKTNNLIELREEIDVLDEQLLGILEERMKRVRKVGLHKKQNDIEPLDSGRWEALLKSRLARAEQLNLNPDVIKNIFEGIHEAALEIEKGC